MGSNLDSVVNLIVTSNAETPQLLLKSWLDEFYSTSRISGLSSSQLIKMITFLCNSPTLAMTTRLYIIEKCLLPNEYVTKDLINVVIRQLGTATAISDSELQVPEKLQVSLCKWLVHIFFLLDDTDGSNTPCLNCSIWLHLWQFDFLQHWLTYIVLWSTASPKDVKRWKIVLLGRVGSKPNYRDSQACATLLLKRFESVAGTSDLITRTISNLKCNKRRLKSLQGFQYDEEFMAQLREVLLSQPSPTFTDDVLDELVASSLEQLKCSVMNKRRSMPSFETERLPLLKTHPLSMLASQWDNILAPLNVEQFLINMKRSPCHFYLLSLSKEEKFWTIAHKWMCIRLSMLFKKTTDGSGNEATLCIVRDTIKICQIFDSLTSLIIQRFFTADNLNSNPEGFLLLFTGLFSLPHMFKLDHRVFNKNALQVLATSILNRRFKQLIFPLIGNAILQLSKNLLYTDNLRWIPEISELIQNIQRLLISAYSNVIENRLITLALINTSKAILIIPKLCSPKVELKNLIAPPSVVQRQFISDDPLLLDSCCYYLICTRNYLLGEDSANAFVKLQNNYILDLTNYLWRNKLVEAKKFLGIPSDFLRMVIDNLYLPDVGTKTRSLFSVTGIPALSYASIAKVRQLESSQDVKVRYSELLTEESFKNFRRSSRFEYWIKDVTTLNELKIEILKVFNDTGPYNYIAIFLFTYLKSLSQYSVDI